MKRAFFLVLLVHCFLSTRSFSEARPITLDSTLVLTGESGFFLSREDMEVAVNDMEKLDLLQRDYDTVKGFYQEQLTLNQQLYIENNKLDRKVSNLRLLGWCLGILAAGSTASLIWMALR